MRKSVNSDYISLYPGRSFPIARDVIPKLAFQPYGRVKKDLTRSGRKRGPRPVPRTLLQTRSAWALFEITHLPGLEVCWKTDDEGERLARLQSKLEAKVCDPMTEPHQKGLCREALKAFSDPLCPRAKGADVPYGAILEFIGDFVTARKFGLSVRTLQRALRQRRTKSEGSGNYVRCGDCGWHGFTQSPYCPKCDDIILCNDAFHILERDTSATNLNLRPVQPQAVVTPITPTIRGNLRTRTDWGNRLEQRSKSNNSVAPNEELRIPASVPLLQSTRV